VIFAATRAGERADRLTALKVKVGVLLGHGAGIGVAAEQARPPPLVRAYIAATLLVQADGRRAALPRDLVAARQQKGARPPRLADDLHTRLCGM